ncbi:unnamed protein product [Paramecium primaurelia]|uniref:Ubiquitin-like domain-containing protein n=1 Tax=Paramecium primaurelia TaxID=5886 RepID=A0A8S1L6H2_PARPR|nr:unnamed protein product [Paramecium primaurelia]
MDSVNIIIECPSKNKRYNIEITNDVTPSQLEQEFKEQFFNNDEKLKFYYLNQPLINNKPLLQQNVVKGSLIIIRVSYPLTLMVPIMNKCYQIDFEETWTTEDLSQKIQELLQIRSEEVQFQCGQQILKPQIPLMQQGVVPKCTITANIQQRGGQQC